ncbi:MAG: hypothetical protein HQL39_15135, partial [Alphaproteobacteria bacterium]|nr:hypothetical protein [Alphaproteobacteria bacterium]
EGFTDRDGIGHLPGWLTLATDGERAAAGVVPVTRGERPDYRFYTAAEVRDGPSITYAATARPLAEVQAEEVARIKAAAGAIITGRYPLTAQLNAQARAVELVEIGAGNWTAEQAAEAEGLRAMRAWINAVRAASNAGEAAVLACSTVEKIAEIPAIVWPE